MRRLLLGVPLVLGLGVIAPHAGLSETISEGMSSPTFGIFSIGSFGSGAWSGEFQSQGMLMSNGVFYSHGMEIPSFSGGGPSTGTGTMDYSTGYLTSDGSSPHGGSDLSGSGGSAGGGSAGGSVNNDPLTNPFSLPGFAGILDGGGTDWVGGVESFNANYFDFHDADHSDHQGNHDRDPIPEPMTIALLGTALLGFGVIRRRKA